MQERTMRGIFPILCTPFFDDGQIDEASLRRVVDFNIQAGVHGLGIALASEVFKLTEAERERVTTIVVEQAAGRVPVVVNTGAAGTDLAVHYSRAAHANGADALMIMPPNFMGASNEEVVDYFKAINDAVPLPIFIQDTQMVPVSTGLARQLAESCEWVQYIKVESQPVTAKVAAMQEQVGDKLVIFGGAGGGYFIEEMRRGSVGTMPFCTQPEAFVEIWNRCQAGDEAGARAVFNRYLLPVARLSGQGGGLHFGIHKEILRRRGIFTTGKVRSPSSPLDPYTAAELKAIVEELYPNDTE